MVALYLPSTFDRVKMSLYLLYVRLKWFIVQVLTVIVLVSLLLWSSVFLYASFYYIYMPSVVHERPVHFSFKADCDSVDKLCSFPTANMSLLANNRELLAFGQPYVVRLKLEMPESYANQRLGMFMIQLQFYSRHGEVVFTTARAAVLSYKSWLYRTLETLIFFLPSLFIRMTVLKQTLDIELCESYLSDPYRPTLGVIVEVQSKRVDIYNATMFIHAKFSGLRYLLYHWPLVSAVIGIGVNFFFLSLTVLFSWCAFVTRSKDELEFLTKSSSKTSAVEDLDSFYDADDNNLKMMPDSTRLALDSPDSTGMKTVPDDDLCGTGFPKMEFGDDRTQDDHPVSFIGFDGLKRRHVRDKDK